MSWLKCHRSREFDELLRLRPNAFLVLALIASRCWRGGKGNPYNLSIGEALVGDYTSCGLTRAKYRTALKHLEDMNYITTKTINKGTIAKLEDTTIFDPNFVLSEDSTPIKTTNQGYEKNQQTTTNKKFNKLKKTNKFKEYDSSNLSNQREGKSSVKETSIWNLSKKKEAYEEELKILKDRGWEDAMRHHYDNDDDRKRAVELKKLIKDVITAIQEA